MTFQQILNGDSGNLVRAKLNGMFAELINGEHGAVAAWAFLEMLQRDVSTLTEKEQQDYDALLGRVQGSISYTDRETNKIYSYIDAISGGVGGLIDSPSYDPSGFPADKSVTLIAFGAGTYVNFLDVTDTPITIASDMAITIFFRAAKATYWTYKSKVLSLPGGDYLYCGVATPSTNPGTPSAEVFYLARNEGSYTYFTNAENAAITLPAGIHILKYNRVSWSADTLLLIDSTPTANSSNLVTSGGIKAWGDALYNLLNSLKVNYVNLSEGNRYQDDISIADTEGTSFFYNGKLCWVLPLPDQESDDHLYIAYFTGVNNTGVPTGVFHYVNDTYTETITWGNLSATIKRALYGMTEAQWNALNSGVTSTLVGKMLTKDNVIDVSSVNSFSDYDVNGNAVVGQLYMIGHLPAEVRTFIKRDGNGYLQYFRIFGARYENGNIPALHVFKKDGSVSPTEPFNLVGRYRWDSAPSEYIHSWAVSQPVEYQTQSTVTIRPNVLNIWSDPIATLTISFAPVAVTHTYAEYMMQFTCPTDGDTTLTLPEGIRWANSDELSPEAGATYQISVVGNLAVYCGWDAEEEEEDVV